MKQRLKLELSFMKKAELCRFRLETVEDGDEDKHADLPVLKERRSAWPRARTVSRRGLQEHKGHLRQMCQASAGLGAGLHSMDLLKGVAGTT
jgi:hypothetical protein